MNDTKFTPGPWVIWEGFPFEGGGADLCIGRGETWLANMDHRNPRCPQIHDNGHRMDDCDICSIDAKGITEEQRANAHLIAAAPELYAKLEKFRNWMTRLADQNHEMAKSYRGRFDHLADACAGDAKNYNATASDIDSLLAKARGEA